jgi:flagellar basal body P-ring formation protein FlgA
MARTIHLSRTGLVWPALASLGLSLLATDVAAEARLRAAPVASGTQITLGDLFDGAGAAASTPLGRAPGPGQRVVFSAPVLQSRAAMVGLTWSNREGVRQVVVSGSAASAPTAPTAAQTAAAAPSGEIAVLTRAVPSGQPIGLDDIAFIPAPQSAPADALVDPAALIGMSARRSLAAGRPLRPGDVEPTPAVRRADPVALVFQSGGLMLSLRGRALENGAPGEVIRVLNPETNRTLEAVVEGPGRARVLMPATAATVAANPVSRPGGR